MKNYFCSACGQGFSIPAGNYNRVLCPFCDSDKTAKVEEVKKVRHPLFWPVWIIAYCNLFFLVVVVCHVVFVLLFWGAVVSAFSGLGK